METLILWDYHIKSNRARTKEESFYQSFIWFSRKLLVVSRPMGNFKVITQCNFFIVCFFWNMVIFLNAANYSVCCAGQLYVCVYYIALKINKAPFTAICIGIASGRSIPVFIWLQCCPLWWPSRAPPRPPTWSRPGAGPLSAWWRAATPGPQSPGSSTTRSTLQWNMWVESLLFSKPKNQEVQLQFSFSYLVILCSKSIFFFFKSV